MLAVLSGHTDCVYSLLNKGANVEAKDKRGRTALHRGVKISHRTRTRRIRLVLYLRLLARFLPCGKKWTIEGEMPVLSLS